MSREMWSQVSKFRDGDELNAETLNIPIGQLGDRTTYLYARLQELLASGKMSSVVLTDVELSTNKGEEPDVGNAVYLDKESGCFALAKATMSLYDDFKAADSAFTVGILQSRKGTTGTVVIYGKFLLDTGGASISESDVLESGERFRPGRYYLSSNEAGKLTATPNGPLIYVCSITGSIATNGTFKDAAAILNPQFLDIGTSHVHRTAVLAARPAGTLSVAGYLPESYDADHPEESMTLRIGGEWTSDEEIDYKFWLNQESANWPDGVKLYWSENGGAEHSVNIPAPDAEVKISNGMSVTLSIPGSNSTTAYSGIVSVAKRTWDVTLPEDGKGWLAHMPYAVARLPEGGESSDSSGSSDPQPLVAISGRMDASPATVRVAFPYEIQLLALGGIAEGSTFTYGETTYEFTKDDDSYEGDNTPVPMGTGLADSALYLVEALEKDGAKGMFAVFEDDPGSSGGSGGADSATLLVMDGETVSSGGIVVSWAVDSAPGFDVVGKTDAKMVVFDGEGLVLGDSPVASGIESYKWTSIGRGFTVMVFQDVAGSTATVQTRDVLSCEFVDEEPDAVYDYNVGFDRQIADFWPPVPPKSAALIVNGVEMDNKALRPDGPTVSFGRSTIHWFSDAPGRLPWADGFAEGNPDPACGKFEVMHWVRGFQGSTGPVTSLQVRDGSPIKVVGYGTDSKANVGDLEILADFDFKMVNGGANGFLVPKKVRNGKFIAGPVVERIIGGAGVSVIPQAGCPQGQGSVIIALDNGAYFSQFTDMALENAEQAKIGMFPYIRLKGYSGSITSPSAFTAMMRVPTNLPHGDYVLKMQAAVFGENGFTGAAPRYACFKLEYNILPDYRTPADMRYRSLKTSLLKPDSARTVLVPFGHQVGSGVQYNGFDPVLVKTDDNIGDSDPDVVSNALGEPIPSDADFVGQGISPVLRPGNLVGIRISRAVTEGSVEAYAGPIGFINLAWSLVSTSGGGVLTDLDTIANEIRNLEDEVKDKVSKNALQEVDMLTNTVDGIRESVKDVGGALGAHIVK